MSGYFVRCIECGREQRTGSSPLRDGWPKCCGYTMRLEDNERFKEDIERSMGEIFARAVQDTSVSEWNEKPCVRSLMKSPRHSITRFHFPDTPVAPSGGRHA